MSKAVLVGAVPPIMVKSSRSPADCRLRCSMDFERS